MKVEELTEVQVFDDSGDIIESYSGDELSVELFDNEPSDD